MSGPPIEHDSDTVPGNDVAEVCSIRYHLDEQGIQPMTLPVVWDLGGISQLHLLF